jgi:hypothetical protein
MLGVAVKDPELDRMPIVTEAAAVTFPPRPGPPRREQRVDFRRRMLAFSARRQRPGAGSMLDQLMRAERPTMEWWRQATGLIQAENIKVAVAGGVAANAYMPPRHTADLDLAVQLGDLDPAGQALKTAGWKLVGNLSLYEDLRGTAWHLGSDALDLIGIPGAWGSAAIDAAQNNKRVSGLPTLPLPYVVVMKLISARPQDSADISRMLGSAEEKVVIEVKSVVKRTRPADVEDLEQIIVAGQLEAGPQKK